MVEYGLNGEESDSEYRAVEVESRLMQAISMEVTRTEKRQRYMVVLDLTKHGDQVVVVMDGIRMISTL